MFKRVITTMKMKRENDLKSEKFFELYNFPERVKKIGKHNITFYVPTTVWNNAI